MDIKLNTVKCYLDCPLVPMRREVLGFLVIILASKNLVQENLQDVYDTTICYVMQQQSYHRNHK